MKYLQEFNVDTFPWWSGAKDTIAEVRKANKMDELQAHIEDVFFKDVPTATQLNDYVWFNSKDIFNAIGINVDDKEEE